MRLDIGEVLQLEMTHTALNEAGYWGGTATRDDSYSIKLEGNEAGYWGGTATRDDSYSIKLEGNLLKID